MDQEGILGGSLHVSSTADAQQKQVARDTSLQQR